MKTKKKETALVFGVTKDFTFALANVLVGLKKHNKVFWDDIVVFHDGVEKHEQESINKILPVKFINLSDSEVFSSLISSDNSIVKKYSIATFYRYECFNLLKDYKRVIWNDVDILIQGDISGLLEYGEKSGVAFSEALSNFVVGSSLKKFVPSYNMYSPLWNVGIMVLTDKLKNYMEIYNWCIKKTSDEQENLLWPDLAVLNLMLQEFSIEPENIDGQKYVCLPMSENADEALILHAYGDKKFWNGLDYYQAYPEWQNNAIEWSKIAYQETKDKTPLVSCILSCYERYDYLKESIFSLLAQTYSNMEIIVVLEKSSAQKDIEKVLKQINDKRIVIVNNKTKLGFPASLNVGIDLAQGKYIARLDDDDISLPLRFSKQVKFLEQNENIGIVGSDMFVFGREDGYAPTFSKSSYIKASTLVESPFKHPTVMMRKEVLEKNNIRYDPDYFTEDYELWSRMVYLTDGLNLPEALVCYRSHDLQSTSSGTNNNEKKIHNSHKRVMFNQFKQHLGLELNDNELEILQTRKNYSDSIHDVYGEAKYKKRTIEKVINANKNKRVYDEEFLVFLLNDRIPGTYPSEKAIKKVMGNYKNRVKKKTTSLPKKTIKKVVRPIINPLYARLVDRMEHVMIEHDKAVQAKFQAEIDKINKKKK